MWRHLIRLLLPALLAAVLGLPAAGAALAQAAPPAARRELAPTGALRLGVVTAAVYNATIDPATGELGGIGVEVGRELARRLGVPLAPVGYPSAAAAIDGVRAGEVDAVVLSLIAAGAADLDSAAPHLVHDVTYAVPAGSPIRAPADADRPGVRIAAPAASAYYLTLERELRSAELVALGGAAAYAALEAGTVHAFAFGRPDLVLEVAQRPGLRVVEGRFMVSELAVAVPKGRPAALAFVTEVVEQAKASGLVQQVIARAGLVGVQAAPPTRGVRLPATGAPAGPASARAPAAAALLLLGTGLAATGHRRRPPRRRPVAASG